MILRRGGLSLTGGYPDTRRRPGRITPHNNIATPDIRLGVEQFLIRNLPPARRGVIGEHVRPMQNFGR